MGWGGVGRVGDGVRSKRACARETAPAQDWEETEAGSGGEEAGRVRGVAHPLPAQAAATRRCEAEALRGVGSYTSRRPPKP